MLGVISMSKQRTPDGPNPKLYDSEKIIDIHPSELESDPTLDSKKVREVKSYTPHLKYTNNSNDKDIKNENNSDPSWGIPTLAKFAHADKNEDVNVYDYRGKLN